VRKLLNLLILLTVTWATSSCATFNVETGTKIDLKPQSILINSGEQPKFSRIVLIASGSFEIVKALGYESKVVGLGITEKVDSSAIPQVTDGHDFNLEKVLNVSPDLILFDDSTSVNSQIIDQLTRVGIVHYELGYTNTVSGITEKIREISKVLGVPKAGNELITKLTQLNVSEQTGVRVAFLYLRGNNSIYLIGGSGSGADDLILSAGGIDVGSLKFDRAFTPLTPEAMVELNPDVFLLMSKGLQSVGGIEGFIKLPGVAQTNAGKNQSIITVDDEMLLSFGISTFHLVEELNKEFKELRETN
jgi:iron complex transport system substrate-binding protein